VCGAVLGLRNGSRLRRRLVRERQIAADVSAFTYDLSKGSDLLVVDTTARPGIGAEQLEQEVAYEIDTIVRDGLEESEVQRAVAVIQTAFVSGMQEAGDRADRLSMFATYLGRPEAINEEVDRYQAVTTAAVNEFVRERLDENNRASLLYVPREESPSELVEAGTAVAAQ
jgi:predicted Zn-dependent peptidase